MSISPRILFPLWLWASLYVALSGKYFFRQSHHHKKAAPQDKEVLNMDACDCVGVILSDAYLDNGKIFEHTETHYSPDHFAFVEFSQR